MPKIVQSQYVITDFLKTIINNKGREMLVFDFEKITSVAFGSVLIVSPRGLYGKTYGGKEHAKHRWDKNGETTLWLRNLVKDLGIEKSKFFKKIPPNYQGCYMAGSQKKNTLGIYDKNGNQFISFQAMNSAEDEKGSREFYTLTIWDEFNVNANLVNDILTKFDSLIHSGEDIVHNYGEIDPSKIIIFGNNKSLNHPLIVALGVSSIKYEITEVWEDDCPVMLIIWVKMSEKQKAKFELDNKMNYRYNLSKILGKAEHSYFNESLYDVDNYVYNIVEGVINHNKLNNTNIKLADVMKLVCTIYHNKYFINIYQFTNISIPLKTKFHVIRVEEVDKHLMHPKHTYYLQVYDKLEGVKPAITGMKLKLAIHLGYNRISFNDVVAREIFISAIR